MRTGWAEEPGDEDDADHTTGQLNTQETTLSGSWREMIMMTCTAETSIDIDFQIIEIKESRLNDLIIISFRFSFHIPDFNCSIN